MQLLMTDNSPSWRPLRSAVLLVHTVSSCGYPLTGDDGATAGVTVAVVEADLPGPPAQRGLHSPDYSRQLRPCPTLYTEIHSSKKGGGVVRQCCSQRHHSLSASDVKPFL